MTCIGVVDLLVVQVTMEVEKTERGLMVLMMQVH